MDRDDELDLRALRAATHRNSLAARGPFALGMLAVGVALAAAVYLFHELGSLPTGVTPTPPTVSIDQGNAPTQAEQQDVFVLLRFQGSAEVAVDGKVLGRWRGPVRLAVPPGRRQLEVRQDGRRVQRVVVLAPRAGEAVLDFRERRGDEGSAEKQENENE